MVILVEVIRKAYLASVVPVVVNTILNEHQLVVDIIAFVSKGDFPRSRLGEKQRGKILASWVTRKMRTIAQFSIRDPDGADSQITEVPGNRNSTIPSFRQSSTMMTGSTVPDINSSAKTSPLGIEQQYASMQSNITDVAGTGEYENSIMPSPPLDTEKIPLDEDTPTNSQNGRFSAPYPHNQMSLPPIEPWVENNYDRNTDSDGTPQAELPAFSYESAPPAPKFDSKPTLSLPETRGDENLGIDANQWKGTEQGLSAWPDASQRRSSNMSSSTTGNTLGKLRVSNMAEGDGAEEWPQEALRHMKIADRGSQKRMGSREVSESQSSVAARYDGSGYGNAM